MSNSIKPPSGPIGTPVIPEQPKAGEASRADFRAELVTTPDIPSTRETGPSTPITGAGGIDATKAITDDLRAGRITTAQAVDALVARALDTPMANALTPEAKQRLESVIRTQLVNDPALAALVSDLDKGR